MVKVNRRAKKRRFQEHKDQGTRTSQSNHSEDLCMNCLHANSCIYIKRNRGPILFCNEYDASTEKKPLDYVDNFPSINDYAEYKGLCMNCIYRDSCKNAISEGGIWHCEEYSCNGIK